MLFGLSEVFWGIFLSIATQSIYIGESGYGILELLNLTMRMHIYLKVCRHDVVDYRRMQIAETQCHTVRNKRHDGQEELVFIDRLDMEVYRECHLLKLSHTHVFYNTVT